MKTERGRPPAESSFHITKRKRDILELLADGLSTKQIAARLSLSRHTVAEHIEDMEHKLGARTRVHLMTLAQKHGLLPTVPSRVAPGES